MTYYFFENNFGEVEAFKTKEEAIKTRTIYLQKSDLDDRDFSSIYSYTDEELEKSYSTTEDNDDFYYNYPREKKAVEIIKNERR